MSKFSFEKICENPPHAIILESLNSENANKEALKIAKSILCLASEKKPCGQCGSCVKVAKGFHPDLKIVSLEKDTKSIKIEEIRNVRQDAYILPNEGTYKVYIFTPAEALTVQAQNAFIKILEEPPRNVVFILVCKSSDLLLSTVLSRCEIFNLNESEDETFDTELENKCGEVLNLSFAGKPSEVLKVLASLPADRTFLKNFVLCLMKGLIGLVKNPQSDVSLERVDKMFDDLKFCFELISKNVNINLIISMVSMAL